MISRAWVRTALLLCCGLASQAAWARYYPKLYTSTRANGMGGAYVALADDEAAIFLNPAGLAGVKGFTFNYAAADMEVSTDSIALGMEGLAGFSDLSGDTLNMAMGKNVYSHLQFAPSLIMPGFGVAFLSDHQASFTEQVVSNPDIQLGMQSTNGIQAAVGASVLPKRMRLRQDLRVGVAAKMLWRRGGYYNLTFVDLLNLTNDPTGSLHELLGNYGVGYGVDLGTQYLFNMTKKLTLSTALVMTNIGDTTFAAPRASAEKANLTWGLAASYKLSRIKLAFAFDYSNILQPNDFRSRTHTGFEAQLPFISLYAGLNQLNLTYGAAFDLWIFRITAASYGEERGTFGGQNTERRYAARIALKIGF